MEHVSYVSEDDIYELVKVKSSIEAVEDLQDVEELIKGTDIDEYTEKMVLSVTQGNAFRVFENGVKKGFVYSYVLDDKLYGASIKLNGYKVMAIGLKHIFDILDYPKLEFMPHEGIHQFKSMITGSSIRLYNNYGSPVKILRSEVMEKGYKVAKYFNLKYGWCNI